MLGTKILKHKSLLFVYSDKQISIFKYEEDSFLKNKIKTIQTNLPISNIFFIKRNESDEISFFVQNQNLEFSQISFNLLSIHGDIIEIKTQEIPKNLTEFTFFFSKIGQNKNHFLAKKTNSLKRKNKFDDSIDVSKSNKEYDVFENDHSSYHSSIVSDKRECNSLSFYFSKLQIYFPFVFHNFNNQLEISYITDIKNKLDLK